MIIDADITASELIEPGQQAHQSRLATAGATYQGYCLPCRNSQGNTLPYVIKLIPVPERHLIKFDPSFHQLGSVFTTVFFRLLVHGLQYDVGSSNALLDLG